MADPITLDEARAAKRQAQHQLQHHADLAGVGITSVNGGYGVQVNLRQSDNATAAVPARIGRVPVVVQVVGLLSKRRVP